jgi:hypothetical protein
MRRGARQHSAVRYAAGAPLCDHRARCDHAHADQAACV